MIRKNKSYTGIESIGSSLMESEWIQEDYLKHFQFYPFQLSRRFQIFSVRHLICLLAIHPDSDKIKSKLQPKKKKQ